MAASVKDVARLAGVSVGTVSNVINRPDTVAPATAERVRDAIRQLGFVRNDAARQLRAGRSNAIGLVVLDTTNPFFADLARGAEERAAAAGLSVILGNSDEKSEREAAYLDLFEQQRMRGVLISPVGDIEPRLAQLHGHGIPAVIVDRTSREGRFSSVAVDDITGGELAVAHLVETGRRRLAYVAGPDGIRQVADRRTGAERAAAAAGLAIESVPMPALSVEAGLRAGEALAARPEEARPDGVFAANDLMALGVLQALTRAGLRVPEDVALIGYDDILFAAAAAVPLSSVRQPSAKIGATAVEILLEEERMPGSALRRIEFAPQLVVRESTAGRAAVRTATRR